MEARSFKMCVWAPNFSSEKCGIAFISTFFIFSKAAWTPDKLFFRSVLNPFYNKSAVFTLVPVYWHKFIEAGRLQKLRKIGKRTLEQAGLQIRPEGLRGEQTEFL